MAITPVCSMAFFRPLECPQLRCAEAEKNHETSRISGATYGKQKAKKAEAKGKDGAVPNRYPHPAKPPVSNDLSEQDADNLLNKGYCNLTFPSDLRCQGPI